MIPSSGSVPSDVETVKLKDVFILAYQSSKNVDEIIYAEELKVVPSYRIAVPTR